MRRHPRHRFKVAAPELLGALNELSTLQVELDASGRGVTAADVLASLSAILSRLPHCKPASRTPWLDLLLEIKLSQPLPELEAHQLQHLFCHLGLLQRLASVQVMLPLT